MYSATSLIFFLSLTSQSLAAPLTSPTLFGRISGTGPARSGDGSGSGWPSSSDWIGFEDMWNLNVGTINSACTGGVQNSASETQEVHDAILSAASQYGVDSRYILATVMQESHGCVRVGQTGTEVHNPGLMQDHNGDFNCAGAPAGGCSKAAIQGMINDGTGGTAYKTDGSGGRGLQQEIAAAPSFGGKSTSQDVYIAARLYNSGDFSYHTGDDLSNPPDATPSYCQDIANRMIGYVF